MEFIYLFLTFLVYLCSKFLCECFVCRGVREGGTGETARDFIIERERERERENETERPRRQVCIYYEILRLLCLKPLLNSKSHGI